MGTTPFARTLLHSASVGFALMAAPALARPEMLIYQGSVSARTCSILYDNPNCTAGTTRNNLDLINSLPIDGIVLNIPASYDGTLRTTKLDYQTTYNAWLKPLVGTFPKLKGSYLLVNIRDMGDPFDDWTQVKQNWVVLARLARDAGMKGIFFDNEYYQEPYFVFPSTVKYPEKGLRAYQERFRLRGREIMGRMQLVWQGMKIIHAHGPYVSEPATPRQITIDQVGTEPTEMRGFFFAGMLAAAGPAAQVIDGGELYTPRTPADFALNASWRRTGITQVPRSSLIPKPLRASWPQRIKLGAGVYDLPLTDAYTMTPAILASTLTNALNTSDGPVWLFTEGDHDYLVAGGIGPEWIAALRVGVANAAP